VRRTARHAPAHGADRERALDTALRAAARGAMAPAPPTLSAAVRRAVAERAAMRPSAPPVALLATRVVAHPTRLRRGLGALALALACAGLALAFAPGLVLATVGMTGAALVSLLTLGHLLAASAVALLGSMVPAVIAGSVYLAALLLWIRLVRRPLEIS
jgi:hypothetical protein